MKNEDVKLNPMFRNLLPPHSSIVWNLIYEGIKENRKVPPLITWNGVLVDGYVRYDICKELGIPFECTEMEFGSEDEAKFFKIKNQLLQRQITVFQRCEIIYPFEDFIAGYVEKQRRKAISEYRQSGQTNAERHGSKDKDTATIIAGYAQTSKRMWFRAKALIEKADEEAKELLRTDKLKIYPTYLRMQAGEPLIPDTEFLDDTNDVDEFEDEAVIVSEEQDKARSESMNSTAMQTEEGNSAESDYADRTIDATDSRDTTEDFDTEESEVIDDTELDELAELASDEDMHSGEFNPSDPSDPNASNASNDWWDLVRCGDTDREYVPEPESELIGGAKTIVHLDEPIEMHSHEPERNPSEFYYVKDQVRFAMKNMLKELKAGLYQLKTEDFEKRSELFAILEDGYNQAKKLINEETGRN